MPGLPDIFSGPQPWARSPGRREPARPRQGAAERLELTGDLHAQLLKGSRLRGSALASTSGRHPRPASPLVDTRKGEGASRCSGRRPWPSYRDEDRCGYDLFTRSGSDVSSDGRRDAAERVESLTIRPVEAATTRSSLDLLGLLYPLSQNRPMTAGEFARFAEQRRSRAMRGLPPVNKQVLEELHRCQVLIPLFRVDLAPGPNAPAVDLSASLTARHVHTTVIRQLLQGAGQGKTVDPAAAAFEPWPQDRCRSLWPSVESGYLYSCHQLLGLDVAMDFVSDLKPRRTGQRTTWHLDETSLPNQRARQALASWRSLAITLTALDTYYWPRLMQVVRYDLDVWRAALEAFDPAQMLDWLGLSLEQVEHQATSLRTTASFTDNTGAFYDLIRRARAGDWESLRGDAATAMDYRVAATSSTAMPRTSIPEAATRQRMVHR